MGTNDVGKSTSAAQTLTSTLATVTKAPVSVGPTVSMTHSEKLEKFSGQSFKKWQQKMLFYLTTLNLARFLTEDAPALPEGETDPQVVNAMEAWKHSDFLCRNYIMNSLHDSLYGVYAMFKMAKQLWESLDKKYKTEDVGAKKFVVGRFLDYLMVDSKTVMSQVQELQVILHEIQAEGMVLSETFQVATVIEKLPPGWKDFKNYLKHKRKEMNMEELVVRLRIEEGNRRSEQKEASNSLAAKANVVEYGQNSKMKKVIPKIGVKKGVMKRKFGGKCFNCGKAGHKSTECKLPKKEALVAHLEDDFDDDDIDLIA